LLVNVSDLIVRFFFYYPYDYGFGAHPHDLEAVDVVVESVDLGVAGRGLAIRVVAAAAHGSGWYTNELKVKCDDDHLLDLSRREPCDSLALPIHVFVEEGKHAMAPDRNADGMFNPGFDITEHLGDAWGIRDTIATSRLRVPGPGFALDAFKQRKPDDKVQSGGLDSNALQKPKRCLWCGPQHRRGRLHHDHGHGARRHASRMDDGFIDKLNKTKSTAGFLAAVDHAFGRNRPNGMPSGSRTTAS
jgi:hypothetical protein